MDDLREEVCFSINFKLTNHNCLLLGQFVIESFLLKIFLLLDRLSLPFKPIGYRWPVRIKQFIQGKRGDVSEVSVRLWVVFRALLCSLSKHFDACRPCFCIPWLLRKKNACIARRLINIVKFSIFFFFFPVSCVSFNL